METDLTKILAISGSPGLFKYVAQGKNGIIVESLSDARRTMVSGAAKVSALGDIAIYTDTKEVPLGEIFQSIFADKSGKEVAIDNKSTPEQLKAFMEGILPDYDRDRVHNSDIKKLGTWYNALVKAGFTKFVIEEQEEEPAEDNAEAAKKPAKAKDGDVVKKAAPKKAPVQRKPTTSGSKVAATRSTTNRKSGS